MIPLSRRSFLNVMATRCLLCLMCIFSCSPPPGQPVQISPADLRCFHRSHSKHHAVDWPHVFEPMLLAPGHGMAAAPASLYSMRDVV